MDQLTYQYKGNRLIAVNDAISGSLQGVGDFTGIVSTPDPAIPATWEYRYDPNGNITHDANKGMDIFYNHLNKPIETDFGNGDRIEWLYNAAGVKLQKKVYTSNILTSTRDYISGFEYENGDLNFFATEEGRATVISNTGGMWEFQYEYHFRDHLGNMRLAFTDLDGNGSINPQTEILQEAHYYPFGLRMAGLQTPQVGQENMYLYNGKELNTEFGLDWHDYGFRMYNAAIGRWNGVDPLAEKYYSFSPYNYVMNNPLNYVDPDGAQVQGADSYNYSIRVNYPSMVLASR